MISLFALLALIWYCHRVLWGIAVRAIVFALGFRSGWKLMGDRR
jgi:hypothetical protein